MYSHDCDRSLMFVFHFIKSVTVFMFIRFSPSSFVCVRRNQLGNPAFRATIVEDTHLTLAAFPFSVGVNNAVFFWPLQTYEKNLPGFRSCRIYKFLARGIWFLELDWNWLGWNCKSFAAIILICRVKSFKSKLLIIFFNNYVL